MPTHRVTAVSPNGQVVQSSRQLSVVTHRRYNLEYLAHAFDGRSVGERRHPQASGAP
jgi:hypothetical protein